VNTIIVFHPLSYLIYKQSELLFYSMLFYIILEKIKRGVYSTHNNEG